MSSPYQYPFQHFPSLAYSRDNKRDLPLQTLKIVIMPSFHHLSPFTTTLRALSKPSDSLPLLRRSALSLQLANPRSLTHPFHSIASSLPPYQAPTSINIPQRRPVALSIWTPHLTTSWSRGMKVRSSVKKLCDGCKVSSD